jgi:hypothetical protein
MRALERDQHARWPNAGEMLGAINRYLYSLDETPGAREVAALVARFCPPETRRLPTHLEAAHHIDNDQVADEPSGPVLSGPSTAVVPRDSASEPMGKRGGRQQTFATHIELEGLLERASTGSIVEAEPAEERGPKTRVVPRPADGDKASSAPPPQPHVPIGEPPSRALLVLVGLGGIALTVAAVYVFYKRRDAVLRDDAMVAPRDAAQMFASPEAGAPDDATVEVVQPADARSAPRDAQVVLPRPDAGASHVVDATAAGTAVRIDAGTLAHPDATQAAASATLVVGATPWGEVYIDGVHMKARAPHEFRVTAGHHDVKVVFPAESPPLEQTFSIDLGSGDTKSVQADFAH